MALTPPSNKKMLLLLDRALEMCEETQENGQTKLTPHLLAALNQYLKQIGFLALRRKVGDLISEAADDILELQVEYVTPWPKAVRNRKKSDKA